MNFFVVLGVDLHKGFVDLDGFGVDVAFEGDSWVSNKVIIP